MKTTKLLEDNRKNDERMFNICHWGIRNLETITHHHTPKARTWIDKGSQVFLVTKWCGHFWRGFADPFLFEKSFFLIFMYTYMVYVYVYNAYMYIYTYMYLYTPHNIYN